MTAVTNQGSTFALTLAGLSTATRVNVSDTSTAGQVVTFDGVTGTADSATIGLSNVSGAASLSVLGIETLGIVSGGTAANTLATLTTDTATRLNISGTQGLTITADTIAPVSYVDASANTATGAGVDVDLAVGAVTVVGGTGNDSFEFNVAGAVSAVGGAGNDTFDFTGTTNTFTVADSVAGGDGSADTVVIDHDDAVAITTPMTATTGGTVAGVERITLNGFTDDGNARTVTLANISSELNYVRLDSVTGATANTVTVNYGAGAATLSLNVAAAISAGDTLVLDAAGTGTADSLSIVNSRTATSNIGTATSNITITDFESVSINSGSYATAVNQNLGVVNAGTSAAITVAGGNSLVLAAGLTAASINASGLTGSAILSMGAATAIGSITGGANNDVLVGDASSSINGGAGDDTVTGGTGNDTLIGGDGADTITNSGGATDSVDGGNGNDTVVAVLTAGNTITGGAGNDTLSLATAGTAGTAQGVSGFEVLTFTANAGTQDMAVFLDNNTFNRVVAGAATTTFSNASNTVSTIATDAARTATTISRLVDTTSNSLNVEIASGTTLATLTANDEESLTVTSSGTGAATITNLAAGDLRSLTITGSGAVSISAGAGTFANATSTGTTLTVNGQANSGGVTFDATGASLVASITGSAAAANTLTGTAGGDTIVGGSAADTIVGAAGADVLTGGGGADTFTFANSATGIPTATNWDSITDYQTGVDIIDGPGTLALVAEGTLGAGQASISATGLATFNVADSTLALRIAAVEAGMTAATAAANETAVFNFGGDAYIFISDGTAGVGATDVLIKLVGITAATGLTVATGDITAVA